MTPLTPAAGLAATLVLLGGLVSLRSAPALGAALGVAVVLALLIAPRPRDLARALWVLPFGAAAVVLLPFVTPGVHVVATYQLGPFVLTVTAEGLKQASVILGRLAAAALLVAATSARLGQQALLEALAGLRVPPMLVSLFAFTLRYTGVIAAEARRMQTARRARAFAVRRGLFDRHAAVTYGQLLGVLFTRSKDRAERVFLAMLARGYRPAGGGGAARRPPFLASPGDLLAVVASAATTVVLILLDRGLIHHG
ncbi:MAG: energy-coupling factor transporter transmembrane component T family protein [Chitinophagales bacterium]